MTSPVLVGLRAEVFDRLLDRLLEYRTHTGQVQSRVDALADSLEQAGQHDTATQVRLLTGGTP